MPLPRNPKSNNTMSCPFPYASSVRFRQCGSSFARDATQAEHQVRNGMSVAECNSLSNSLGSAGAFFTRASRPSLLISMSAALHGFGHVRQTDRQTEAHHERMTHLARSRSQHNKNHLDKTTHYRTCLPQAFHLSSHHLIAKHVSPCSRQRSPSEPSHQDGLHALLPTSSSKHKVRRGYRKTYPFLDPGLAAGSLPPDPPVENHHTFSRLVLTSYRSQSTRVDYSLCLVA